MVKRIDTTARIESVRLEEQGSAPVSPGAGFTHVWAKSDGLYTVNDSDEEIGPFITGTSSGADTFGYDADGRLTVQTGEPVPTGSFSAVTTIYYTPYVGDQIALYDGASWSLVAFSETSLPLTGFTASTPYDIFAFATGSSIGLEAVEWTDGTTRATLLTKQNGTLVKSGAATRRYLGTILINSTGGQTEDTVIQRFVWNYYNRVSRRLFKSDATSVWTYGTDAWRQSNNAAANKFEVICGVLEDVINVIFSQRVASDNVTGAISIGVNSVAVAGADHDGFILTTATFVGVTIISRYTKVCPNIGYSYFASLERAYSGSNNSFYGADGMGLAGIFLA